MATVLLIVIYILAIGLGIPDSVLGAAWPAMSSDFDINISMINFVSSIVSCGTIVSSLLSAKLLNRFGIAAITSVSTIMTVIALLGYSLSQNLIVICLFAIPLGLGAGAIDSAINNYISLHYKAMYVNFMHCFYGIGVMISPYVMSFALQLRSWRFGYTLAAILQGVIAVIAVLAIPLWKKINRSDDLTSVVRPRTLSLKEMISNPSIRFACLFFFASTSIEAICNVWSGTYMVEIKGFAAADAASYLVAYYFGLTVGRIVSGLLTNRFSPWVIIKIGIISILAGVTVTAFMQSPIFIIMGLFLMGLGVAPVFPCLIYLTPINFGVEVSQSVTGFEMACAYCGTLLAPLMIGLLNGTFTMNCYSVILLCFVAVAGVSYIGLTRNVKNKSSVQ